MSRDPTPDEIARVLAWALRNATPPGVEVEIVRASAVTLKEADEMRRLRAQGYEPHEIAPRFPGLTVREVGDITG